MKTCVIMAGGKGTRLKPVTTEVPKPLVKIADKPIILQIIENFEAFGWDNFIIMAGYMADKVAECVQSHTTRSKIEVAVENLPLGTVGALKGLENVLSDTFVLTNCDILIQDDYNDMLRFHRNKNLDMTIVGVEKTYQIPYGVLHMDEQSMLTAMREKPQMRNFISSGMYILEPHVMGQISDGFMDMDALINKLLFLKRRVGVYTIYQDVWQDIGEWKEFHQTQTGVKFTTCPDCGNGMMIPAGSCAVCNVCGTTTGAC